MLRATKMVLTCRPRSGATPAGSARSMSRCTTRNLDAEMNRPGTEFMLIGASGGSAQNAAGAATTSTQHGATVAMAGSAARPAATEWTSPPVASNTAAGPMTAATSTDDVRRLLANSCLPTASTLRSNRGIHSNVAGSEGRHRDRSGRNVCGFAAPEVHHCRSRHRRRFAGPQRAGAAVFDVPNKSTASAWMHRLAALASCRGRATLGRRPSHPATSPKTSRPSITTTPRQYSYGLIARNLICPPSVKVK